MRWVISKYNRVDFTDNVLVFEELMKCNSVVFSIQIIINKIKYFYKRPDFNSGLFFVFENKIYTDEG